MEEQVFLLNMFAEYEPAEEVREALSQAAIVAADIDPEQRTVSVAIHNGCYIPMAILDQAQKDLELLVGARTRSIQRSLDKVSDYTE